MSEALRNLINGYGGSFDSWKSFDNWVTFVARTNHKEVYKYFERVDGANGLVHLRLRKGIKVEQINTETW